MLLGFTKKRHVLQKWALGREKKMIVDWVPSWIRVVIDFGVIYSWISSRSLSTLYYGKSPLNHYLGCQRVRKPLHQWMLIDINMTEICTALKCKEKRVKNVDVPVWIHHFEMSSVEKRSGPVCSNSTCEPKSQTTSDLHGIFKACAEIGFESQVNPTRKKTRIEDAMPPELRMFSLLKARLELRYSKVAGVYVRHIGFINAGSLIWCTEVFFHIIQESCMKNDKSFMFLSTLILKVIISSTGFPVDSNVFNTAMASR